jgi:hypothetical protein
MQTSHLPPLSRALVPLGAHAHDDAHSHRPIQRVSTFLAQLIATARKLPQASAKRRADPAEVIAAYRATVERLRKLKTHSD